FLTLHTHTGTFVITVEDVRDLFVDPVIGRSAQNELIEEPCRVAQVPLRGRYVHDRLSGMILDRERCAKLHGAPPHFPVAGKELFARDPITAVFRRCFQFHGAIARKPRAADQLSPLSMLRPACASFAFFENAKKRLIFPAVSACASVPRSPSRKLQGRNEGITSQVTFIMASNGT